MNIRNVKEIAIQRGIKVGTMKKGEIIREIQTKEGNSACFDTGKSQECGQHECLWRKDCK